MSDVGFIGLEPAVRNETVAVGTASTLVMERRYSKETERIAYTIRNSSPNATDIITLHFGAGSAVADAGLILRQNEGMSDSSDSGYKCHQGVINAICDTATGQLSITER